jgi:hypothetical protein
MWAADSINNYSSVIKTDCCVLFVMKGKLNNYQYPQWQWRIRKQPKACIGDDNESTA